MRSAIWKTLALIAVAAMLGACSKNSGGVGSSGTAAPSSNWDSMTWDQGNWS